MFLCIQISIFINTRNKIGLNIFCTYTKFPFCDCIYMLSLVKERHSVWAHRRRTTKSDPEEFLHWSIRSSAFQPLSS